MNKKLFSFLLILLPLIFFGQNKKPTGGHGLTIQDFASLQVNDYKPADSLTNATGWGSSYCNNHDNNTLYCVWNYVKIDHGKFDYLEWRYGVFVDPYIFFSSWDYPYMELLEKEIKGYEQVDGKIFQGEKRVYTCIKLGEDQFAIFGKIHPDMKEVNNSFLVISSEKMIEKFWNESDYME